MSRTDPTNDAPRDFWARRKAAVQAEEKADIVAEETAALRAEQVALEDRPDDEVLAELNLPDPDDLKPGDDISGFMAQVVPDRLRRRALRQLWRLNPALANLDGLVDYGEDFTDPSYLLGNMQTAYQVGKGMLAHVEEMARQEEEAMAKEAQAKEAQAGGTDDQPEPENTPEDTAGIQPDHDETAPPCGSTSPPEDPEPEGVSPWPIETTQASGADPLDMPDKIADASHPEFTAPAVPYSDPPYTNSPRPGRMRFHFEG